MAEFKEISPNASAGAKVTNWFENRFPTAFDAYKVHMSEDYAPKNFNFWWIFGCAIFLCLMPEAFMGYLLPWGQMSYWGAQVIVNLFAAIPFIGPDLAL